MRGQIGRLCGRPCEAMWEAVRGQIGRPKWEAKVGGRSGRPCSLISSDRSHDLCEAELGGRGRPM